MFSSRQVLLSIVIAALASAWVTGGHAQTTQTWSTSPSSGNWTVAGNWTSGTAPVGNDSLAFGSTTIATATNNFTAGTQFNGITFNSGAATYTLSGNQIALGGSVTNNSTALQTLSLPLTLSATQSFGAASGGLTLSGVISGAGGLTKTGTGVLTLSGGSANTYSGTSTVSAGELRLNKTAGIDAVAGNLAITGAFLTFGTSNQIANGAAVSMSGTGSVFNGTSYNLGAAGNNALDETIGSLTVTGGIFFPGGSTAPTGFAVTNSASFTGGAGNTDYLQGSGGLASYGSLALTGMSGLAGTNAGVSVANRFVVAGNNTTRLTTLTVGSGGLSLNGSNLLLQLGGASALGSRLVLNGDVSTTGATASSIRAPSSSDGGSTGTRTVELSGTSGTVTRTFAIGGGGANLTVSLPITNGSATTAAIVKAGTGTLTLSASNSYNGGTQINAGTLALGDANALGTTGTISFGGGTLQFSGSNTADYSSRFSTAANQAVSLDTNGQSVSLVSALTSSGGSLTKLGAGTLTLSGGVANTASGTTTISAGTLNLNKPAGITAVAGNLVNTNAIVTFGTSNQIADTASVTMSGSSSFFNNTAFNGGSAGNRNLDETIGSLTVTGGGFFPGGSSTQTTGFVVTGSASFTGGAGNTYFIQTSGGLTSFGSLSLAGLTSTVGTGSSVFSGNRFIVNGSDITRQTTLTIGSGGLSLDGSNLLLMLGSAVGNLGSRLVLNGDVTTTGVTESAIRAPASDDNTVGTRVVALSGTSGTVTRAFTIGGGGADLTVSLPITNGSATTAGIRKLGLGTLTLGTANIYSGATTVSAGTLLLGSAGSFANSPTITVGDTGSSGVVLDLTAKTGTFAFTSSQTVGGIGSIRMDAGDTTQFAGILAPGNSPGILTIDGGTALLSGTTQIEIFGAARGTGYDGIDLINSAAIDYGNGVLALDFGSWLADQQSYQLFGSGSSSLLGGFSSVTIAGSNYGGLTFSKSAGVWTSQGTSTANQTLTFTEATGTLVIVPEPAALALAAAGVGLAAAWARRRRK